MPILTLAHGIPLWFLVLSLFLPRLSLFVGYLYSCPSGVRLVVLDTPGDGRRGMARIRGFSQEEKSAAAR